MARDSAYDDWLRLWGEATGMADLDFDPQGTCAFSVSGKCEVVLEVADEDSTLYLYAPMFGLDSRVDADEEQSRLEQLLKLNYSGRETGGAWFAISQRDRQVLLCATLPRTLLDQGRFLAVLRDFVDNAYGWWCHFNEAAPEAGAGDDSRIEPDEPKPPFNSGLRV